MQLQTSYWRGFCVLVSVVVVEYSLKIGSVTVSHYHYVNYKYIVKEILSLLALTNNAWLKPYITYRWKCVQYLLVNLFFRLHIRTMFSIVVLIRLAVIYQIWVLEQLHFRSVPEWYVCITRIEQSFSYLHLVSLQILSVPTFVEYCYWLKLFIFSH